VFALQTMCSQFARGRLPDCMTRCSVLASERYGVAVTALLRDGLVSVTDGVSGWHLEGLCIWRWLRILKQANVRTRIEIILLKFEVDRNGGEVSANFRGKVEWNKKKEKKKKKHYLPLTSN